MSDVLPDTGWEIQIKQRAGKWVLWCYCTDANMRATWSCIPALRRRARLLRLPDGMVVQHYEPPTMRTSDVAK